MLSRFIEAAGVSGSWLAVAAAGVAVVAYCLGCFNGAVVVSRYILRDDVRKHGSGNAGLTNFHRVYGGPLTAVVILSDVVKAVLAVLFISALTGQRVDRLFDLIDSVVNQAAMRIPTGVLNQVLADAQARVQPPTDKGRRLKIYYMTQIGVKPPHFVIFCNDARLFHFSYQRYLENQIRATFGLTGTPVRITIRQKGDKED